MPAGVGMVGQTETLLGRSARGLVGRKMGVLGLSLVIGVSYWLGYGWAGAADRGLRFWAVDFNPVPWLLALVVAGLYFYRYDEYRSGGGDPRVWSGWRAVSFVAGLLVGLALWESPLNMLVSRSMTLYTAKLMGEFEFAGPLIVLGVPFALVSPEGEKGRFWSAVRFLHRPLVSGIALFVILALWDMADQMAWGLHNAIVFLVLPGVYLTLGMIVWMQSLQVFPSWPNFRNHLRKGIYVWAMELAMMAMGAIWFWSDMKDMNPSVAAPLVWGLSRVADEHMAGALMTGLSLPTMCLVTWHLWQWISSLVGVSESEDYGDEPLRGQEG